MPAEFWAETPEQTAANLRSLGVINDMECGRWGFHMSWKQYQALCDKYPDTLGAPDPEIRRREWIKFWHRSESELYRVKKV